MLWWRKKRKTEDTVSLVQEYAAKLGIERRLNVRIHYPKFQLPALPAVYFGRHKMLVFDLSVGGLCLIDREDRLGPDTGNAVELRLVWPDCERLVRCKLVARVHDRRHIQFLDLNTERVEAIRRAIIPGARGLTMKPVLNEGSKAVELAAKEVWNSLAGDSLVLTLDVHKQAEIRIDGKEYRILKSAWPLLPDGRAANRIEVERILLFLTNIPRPSAGVSILTSQLQSLFVEGV